MVLIFSPFEVGKTIDELLFVKLAVGKTITLIFSIPITGTFLKIYNNFKDKCICNDI